MDRLAHRRQFLSTGPRMAACVTRLVPLLNPPQSIARHSHSMASGKHPLHPPFAGGYQRKTSSVAWRLAVERNGASKHRGCIALAGAAAAAIVATAAEGRARCDQWEAVHRGPSNTVHSCPQNPDYVPLWQRHLLEPSDENPSPTLVPPPTPVLAGTNLHHRYVVSFIGLPLRGKAHMARRLQRYLEFFHGSYVELFDINMFDQTRADDEMLHALSDFFNDEGASAEKQTNFGRAAVIYATDTCGATNSMWSGYSKRRRRWMSETLEKELHAHICFIEIKLEAGSAGSQSDLLNKFQADYQDNVCRQRGLSSVDMEALIKDFEQDFVTIQDDGTEDDLSYMRLINYNQKVVANNMMRGFLGSRMAAYLSCVHPYRHTIYLTRHGESKYNVEKKIGGDSGLSSSGREYALRLAEFADLEISRQADGFTCVTLPPGSGGKVRTLLTKVPQTSYAEVGIYARGIWEGLGDGASGVRDGMRLARVQCGEQQPFQDPAPSVDGLVDQIGDGPASLIFVSGKSHLHGKDLRPARLWTSSLRRTKETAVHIRHPEIDLGGGKVWAQMIHRVFRNLDEVYAGDYEGLTYEEIKRKSPEEASLRKLDKLGYRYPRGESYYDLIARLDHPMRQLETSQEPILIISHQAVLRLVYAFLTGVPRSSAPDLEIPLHTVIKKEFDGTGKIQKETRIYLGPNPVKDDGQRWPDP